MDTSKSIPKWVMKKYYPRFRDTGIRQGWWNETNPIVAGISGGPDSIALLWLLVNLWRGKVIVAHFEHGIRGKESLDDALFVRDLASKMGCPFFMERAPVPKLRQKGESVEEAARRLRYAFLEKVRKENKASYVAVGHHKDDLVETVLFNIIRGTGIRGIQGIPEKREYIIRPLIEFDRSEIIELLDGLKMSWRVDSTNLEVDYTRNKIRLHLIPLLEKEYNPRVKEHIATLSRQAVGIVSQLEAQAEKINNLLRRKPLPYTIITWDRKVLETLELPSQQLAECIRKQQRDLSLTTLSSNRTELLVKLVRESLNWRFQWEDKIEVCADKDFIAWVNWDMNVKFINTSIDLGSQPSGSLFWNGWNISWKRLNKRFQTPKFGSHQCRLLFDDKDDVFLRIISAKNARKILGQTFDFMPWWSKQGWPIFILSCKMWWVPLHGKGGERRAESRSLDAIQIKAQYKRSERM